MKLEPPRWTLFLLAAVTIELGTFIVWSPGEMPWWVRLELLILTMFTSWIFGALWYRKRRT